MALISNAAQLLAAATLKRAELVLPNGDTVLVRELSAGERPEFFHAVKQDPQRSPLLLVEMCAIGPDGTRLFTGDQVAAHAGASPEVIDLIAAKAMELSGMRLADEKKADPTPSETSSSS